MLRHVLLYLAGVPAGFALSIATDLETTVACVAVSVLVVVAAWQAPDHSKPEKALEKRLNGLRIVGREDDR